jgi:hypothetical protein
MSDFNPVWRLKINSVDYTNLILANLTITSGRTDIYTQAVAGYANLTLINLDESLLSFGINQTVSIELQDSTATYVPIFGGTITDIEFSISEIGSVGFSQSYTITALGALARLPKALFLDNLAEAGDGDQIYEVLRTVLLAQWQAVPAALTWATYDPTTQWQDAENTGLGQIDRPGNYTLIARTASAIDVYTLASNIALSGLGILHENSLGQISYDDSTHRTTYLSVNGYTDLSAAEARAAGLMITTRSGDVRNVITIKYGTSLSQSYETEDLDSIALYGSLGQVFSTFLKNTADAEDQAEFYLELRANPQPVFNSITYDLTNSLVDDADRDALISVFMGLPVNITALPLNMNSGQFQGFVEGWTFQASYNQVGITLFVSPLAFSLQAMRWQSVPAPETWNSVSGTLDWINATIVA